MMKGGSGVAWEGFCVKNGGFSVFLTVSWGEPVENLWKSCGKVADFCGFRVEILWNTCGIPVDNSLFLVEKSGCFCGLFVEMLGDSCGLPVDFRWIFV